MLYNNQVILSLFQLFPFSVARGTLQGDTVAGLVSGLATQAKTLKMGTGEDDKPTVVVEFETG